MKFVFNYHSEVNIADSLLPSLTTLLKDRILSDRWSLDEMPKAGNEEKKEEEWREDQKKERKKETDKGKEKIEENTETASGWRQWWFR